MIKITNKEKLIGNDKVYEYLTKVENAINNSDVDSGFINLRRTVESIDDLLIANDEWYKNRSSRLDRPSSEEIIKRLKESNVLSTSQASLFDSIRWLGNKYVHGDNDVSKKDADFKKLKEFTSKLDNELDDLSKKIEFADYLNFKPINNPNVVKTNNTNVNTKNNNGNVNSAKVSPSLKKPEYAYANSTVNANNNVKKNNSFNNYNTRNNNVNNYDIDTINRNKCFYHKYKIRKLRKTLIWLIFKMLFAGAVIGVLVYAMTYNKVPFVDSGMNNEFSEKLLEFFTFGNIFRIMGWNG